MNTIMTTVQQNIIDAVAAHVKQQFSGEASGHDWWHIARVTEVAKRIADEEHADQFVVQLGALLHDIADFKFHNNDLTAGPKAARALLSELDVEKPIIDQVCHIVENVSYKGAAVKSTMESLEGKIVQDADRLDALGAIGIARVFAFGGAAGRVLHDPAYEPQLHQTFEAYSSADNPSIGHFHEKLLLLRDRMNTKTGRRIAQNRHSIMEQFLKDFYREWDGQDV